ncbi:MAG: phosphonate ABC transporter, permease protein PhnE [Bacteroidetes bacterium]|nr:phosphonate ABC transporter, permease protein PhnE [bacterium]NBP63828.1 phosphonate ABC transporter, permease protein PhnE [Bacteroidota bacterium]
MSQQSNKSFALQAYLIDLFFVWYIVITLDRIIIPAITSYTPLPGFLVQIGYLFIGLIAALTLKATHQSAARSILSDTHGIMPLIGKHILWLAFSSSIIAGWIITDISPIDFFSTKGLQAASNIFTALVTPELSMFDIALKALIETVYIALTATVIALPPSFILSFLSARTLMKGSTITFSVYTIIRLITNFSRSIEPLIWAIIFSVWVGIGPFAGMLALMVHTVASLTKQYSEQIEDIDHGMIEAIEATGAHPLQVISYAIIPQIVIPFLSFTIYRWDINVRMATIIGLVGGGGIGTMLMQYQGLAQWHEVGLIIIMIAFVVWVMDYISARVREALR